MRIAFIGIGSLSISTAQILIRRGHEVIIVERDKAKIDTVTEELDCGFIHGDGTRPEVQREINPKVTDMLICLTNNDQANIIASLVGRALGFPRVVTKIEDREFEHVGIELGLQDIIVPARAIARFLSDMVEGRDILELSSIIKGEARILSFVAHEEDEEAINNLKLPEQTRVICLYRNGEFLLPDLDSRLKKEDEVVLITHQKNLQTLHDRFVARKDEETNQT